MPTCSPPWIAHAPRAALLAAAVLAGAWLAAAPGHPPWHALLVHGPGPLGHGLPGHAPSGHVPAGAWQHAAEPLLAAARHALRLNSGCPAQHRKIVLQALKCAWLGWRAHIQG